jgi:hypothetical protein
MLSEVNILLRLLEVRELAAYSSSEDTDTECPPPVFHHSEIECEVRYRKASGYIIIAYPGW